MQFDPAGLIPQEPFVAMSPLQQSVSRQTSSSSKNTWHAHSLCISRSEKVKDCSSCPVRRSADAERMDTLVEKRFKSSAHRGRWKQVHRCLPVGPAADEAPCTGHDFISFSVGQGACRPTGLREVQSGAMMSKGSGRHSHKSYCAWSSGHHGAP